MSSTAVAQELILGRYRPLKPLGSGGMGHVWLARDEETGLDVALKMVAREGKAGPRAEREAKAAAALRHPRCQRIYALARDPGHVYIAYEYIPGRTLRHAVQAGELDDAGAVEAAAQILEALAHAHGRGIVHRDVKPSNVLLAESEGIDVRLVDFGLAQMAEFDTLTAIGDVPGTLAYVSPERLHGRDATEAADVWAVGVMLWEALAGRHPFRVGDATETTRRIQAGAPPLETMRPDVPAPLRAAVAGALALNPARRPTAAQLATELRGARKRSQPKERPEIGLDTPALLRDRVLPGALAAAWTGAATSLLPFWPAGWPLGLAELYAALALVWLFIHWRSPRGALLFVAGPIFWPLLPVAALPARGPVRRAAQAAAGIALAAVVAGLRHTPLPLDHGKPPLGLGIAGSRSATACASALERVATAHPALLDGGAVLVAAAVALPYLRGRGPWPAALGGAAFLTALAVAAPQAPFLPLAAGAWACAALVALPRRG